MFRCQKMLRFKKKKKKLYGYTPNSKTKTKSFKKRLGSPGECVRMTTSSCGVWTRYKRRLVPRARAGIRPRSSGFPRGGCSRRSGGGEKTRRAPRSRARSARLSTPRRAAERPPSVPKGAPRSGFPWFLFSLF